MPKIEEIKDVLVGLQTKQNKYRYDFFILYEFNQLQKQVFNRYKIIKYHTEVIEHKRLKITDETKVGGLNDCFFYLLSELKGVDSS